MFALSQRWIYASSRYYKLVALPPYRFFRRKNGQRERERGGVRKQRKPTMERNTNLLGCFLHLMPTVIYHDLNRHFRFASANSFDFGDVIKLNAVAKHELSISNCTILRHFQVFVVHCGLRQKPKKKHKHKKMRTRRKFAHKFVINSNMEVIMNVSLQTSLEQKSLSSIFKSVSRKSKARRRRKRVRERVRGRELEMRTGLMARRT